MRFDFLECKYRLIEDQNVEMEYQHFHIDLENDKKDMHHQIELVYMIDIVFVIVMNQNRWNTS